MSQTILVLGATGYVGARLVRRLLADGRRVRCLVRTPEKLQAYAWRDHPNLEVRRGDLEDRESIAEALRDVDAAYYLVHSMIAAGSDYATQDRRLAMNFVAEVNRSGCRKVCYLGGLGETHKDLSLHLRSRREVADILRSGEAAVTEFRAAMIIGSGSASFEILRYLVERLPLMITPIWVQTETQPIAIRDVLRYLHQWLDTPAAAGRTLDIGGTDVMSYRDMIHVMARHLGVHRRIVIPVPVLSPKLSSYWIGYVTPVSPAIARPLAEGLRNRTVCRSDDATRLMPGPLWGVEEAIEAAVGRERTGDVETRWSTAGAMPGDPDWAGGTTLRDRRTVSIKAPADVVFDVVETVGGDSGYWGAGFLWRLRGWMDSVVGGPGLRRNRRDPEELSFGEAVDFWRVTAYEPGRRLRLRAEMKLPGIGELEFTLDPKEAGEAPVTELTLEARFRPTGLTGLAYWYGVLPLHEIVFPLMTRGIRREAESRYRERLSFSSARAA